MAEETEEKTAKEVKEENAQVTETVKGGKTIAKRKGVASVTQSHIQWDFNENNIFAGYYVGENKADVPDRADKTKILKDKVIGYIVEDEDGEQWTIPNWALIEKGLNLPFKHPKQGEVTLKTQPTDARSLFQIEHGGKGAKSNGDEFTVINMDILEY